jgi:tetratricopeptide (TPR) repeat protein
MISEVFKDFWTVLGFTYLQHKKFQKAQVVFELLEHFFGNDPLILKSLSYVYLKLKDYNKALFYADKYLESCPNEKEKKTAFLLKSQALWHLGKREEAKEFMLKFLAV